ncbi:MAG TPA: DUF5004 domain-containing protein [Flavobacteriales bacterium]
MKKIYYIAIALLIASCKPEIKGELGEPFNKMEAMNGMWELSAFMQRDENNPIKEVRDMSEFYIVPGEVSTRFQFNSDDMTYTVVPGPGRNFFGNSGTWHFDNSEAPSYIILENETDTFEVKLGSSPRSYTSYLTLELPRYCVDNSGNSTPTVTYIFTINRINP